ncbi:MAG: glycosyltransferase [Candidatus Bathyarchaeota archaeon]|nr:glycosyltransferase [Candidatus Bathyarchaeota archaeon]
MEKKISVVLTIRNVEKYIEQCLESILDQTIKDFEIVILDDMSDDSTQKKVEKFDDCRIRYFRNQKRLGLTKNRNRSLKYAIGEYVFFTDGDCIVSRNWIAEGLRYLKEPNCVGVEGKIYYVSKDYKPTFSDHVCKNEDGGMFMTGNMAYKKRTIEDVGGFDERYSYHEDRDLALRIKNRGDKIYFNPNMIVCVQKEILTPKEFIRRKIIKNRVYLFKRFGEKKRIIWRIVDPINLAKIIFPPLVYISLMSNRFKNSCDYRLIPFIYIRSLLERLQLWNTSARERVFLI